VSNPPRPTAPARRNVAVLMFNDVEELDFAGPWEVFAYLRSQRPELCDVYTVSERGGEVRCAKGLRVVADYSFAAAPPADLLIVPGGQGRRVEVSNPRVIDFIKRCAGRAELTASVCTGAFLLERAGLLTGRRATTYWAALDELRALGTARVVEQRWVDEGNVFTAAGVSAGIDLSLFLVGRLWGPDVARSVQKGIEYFPDPPYQDAAGEAVPKP
jgi:transcriptional regulator GlxA family with amidase domain